MLGRLLPHYQTHRASRQACNTSMEERVSSTTDSARRVMDGVHRTAAHGQGLASSPTVENKRRSRLSMRT
jgi:hypothetical protein